LAQVKSTADLRRLLVPGMSTNEIATTIGDPSRTQIESENDTVVWRCALPPFHADDQMQGTYVIGVSITFTNGRLAWWGCAYTGGRITTCVGDETLASRGERSSSPGLRFYIVSSAPKAGFELVDTGQFPKLGYVPPNPTLVINQVREVTLVERKASDETNSVWSFRISVLPEDTARLKLVTATNIGDRMLIKVGDEPVIAPRILAPLETGGFELECGERALMEGVKQALERIGRGRN